MRSISLRLPLIPALSHGLFGWFRVYASRQPRLFVAYIFFSDSVHRLQVFLELVHFFRLLSFFPFFFPPHIETSAIFCQTVSDGRGCQNLRCSFVRPFSRLSLFLFLAAISSVPFLFTLVRPPLPPDNFNRLSRVSLFLSRRLCFISPMIFIS